MEILIDNQQAMKPISAKRIQKTARAILDALASPEAELSLLVVDDDGIAPLNQAYRGRTGPTNVLAFPMQEGAFSDLNPHLLGDVVISVETCQHEADAAGTTFEKRFNELLIHGILHLFGYDHEKSFTEAERMRRKSETLLEHLGLGTTDATIPAIIIKPFGRMPVMPDLIVNVDHAAVFRNLAPGRQPDPVSVAVLAEMAGAVGIFARITANRRPISDRDIRVLRETVQGHFSLGVAPTAEMMGLVLNVKPDAVVLMPERPEEASAEGGLDLILDRRAIADTITSLRESNIPAFLFIDPDPENVKVAHRLNAGGVQINTHTYAKQASTSTRRRMLARIVDSVKMAARLKLRVLTGRGLDCQASRPLGRLKEIEACVIGHRLMARALLTGMESAVREMIMALKGR